MANVKNTISLQDKMTPVLSKIMRAMNSSMKVMETMNKSLNKGGNTKNFQRMQKDIQAADNAIKKFNNGIDKTIDLVNNCGNKFNTFQMFAANALGNIAANAVAKAGNFLSNSTVTALEKASDLQEVQNIVDVTYGNSAKVVDDWSKTTLNAYGLNELAAKEMAGTMGAMLKSSGLATKAALDMSLSLTQLTGDMASFYNLGADETFTKIRSGISGEIEPLKQLGINMSVANLEAFALSKGVTKAYKSMSQAEQVMLRYNYLMKVSADSQGDFARTSSSYANQQKLLKENWADFTSGIAKGVLPILAILTRGLNSMIGFISEHRGILYGFAIVMGVFLTACIIAAWGVINSYVIMAAKAVWAALVTMKSWAVANWQMFALAIVIGILIAFWQQLGSTGQAVGIGIIVTLILIQLAAWGVPIPFLFLIGILLLVVAEFIFFGDSATKTLGVIVGGIFWLGAVIWNTVTGVINAVIQFMWWKFVEPFISIIEHILNVTNGGFNNFGDSVKNLLGNIISWFLSLGKVVTKIIDAIFGTNWTAGLSALQGKLLEWGKNENAITLSREAPTIGNRIEYREAFDIGNQVGIEVGQGIQSFIGNVGDKLNGLINQVGQTNDLLDYGNALTAAGDTSGLGAGDGKDVKVKGGKLDEVGKIGSDVTISDEDIKLMRDAAKIDFVNQFTTLQPNMKVSFGDVKETADVNAILRAIEDMTERALASRLVGV